MTISNLNSSDYYYSLLESGSSTSTGTSSTNSTSTSSTFSTYWGDGTVTSNSGSDLSVLA